jgi:hypothetical protein
MSALNWLLVPFYLVRGALWLRRLGGKRPFRYAR